MNIKTFLTIGLATTFLTVSGCASTTSAWDWFFEDDETQVADEQTAEEMMEEEIMKMEEELADERMMDEELMMEEELLDEEMMEEEMMEDDYGDRPQANVQGSRAPNMVVYFNYKSTSVSADGLNILQMHANQLMGNQRLNVVLVGHTDSVAPSDYNKRLALRRAQSVAGVLVRMGVPESRIRVRSAGEDNPAARGDDEQAHALNRRVEIIYQ